MNTRAVEAMHDIHTATNDVLKGYREMSSRAEPDIRPVIHRLIELHERHATEQAAELRSLSETGKDDASFQGSVNKVVVILRDWIADLDHDALPAVRQGEESLRDEFDQALQDAQVAGHATVGALLRMQRDTINSEIARLPRD